MWAGTDKTSKATFLSTCLRKTKMDRKGRLKKRREKGEKQIKDILLIH